MRQSQRLTLKPLLAEDPAIDSPVSNASAQTSARAAQAVAEPRAKI